MLLTVIINEYNSKEFLHKCIASISNQSLKELEIIIIDDHSSTKASERDLDEWDDKIRYVYNEKNIGLGASRNIGIGLASGKYICFIDSDDWVDLNYYDTACRYMENHSACIGQVGIYRDIDSHINKSFERFSYKESMIIDKETAIHILSKKYNLGIQFSFTVTSKIFLLKFLKNNELRFIPDVYYEDFSFTVRSFLKAPYVLTIPGTRYHHYKREGSIIQSVNEKHINDFITVFADIKELLESTKQFCIYRDDYYKMLEYYFNIIIKQLFAFTLGEINKKTFLKLLLKKSTSIVDLNDYFNYLNSEEIRNHLQPHLADIITNA